MHSIASVALALAGTAVVIASPISKTGPIQVVFPHFRLSATGGDLKDWLRTCVFNSRSKLIVIPLVQAVLNAHSGAGQNAIEMQPSESQKVRQH